MQSMGLGGLEGLVLHSRLPEEMESTHANAPSDACLDAVCSEYFFQVAM